MEMWCVGDDSVCSLPLIRGTAFLRAEAPWDGWMGGWVARRECRNTERLSKVFFKLDEYMGCVTPKVRSVVGADDLKGFFPTLMNL